MVATLIDFPEMSVTDETGDFEVGVDLHSHEPSVLLTEITMFGETALRFTPEEAERIGLQLLNIARRFQRKEIVVDSPLELVASL